MSTNQATADGQRAGREPRPATLEDLIGFQVARLSNTLARAADLRYLREFDLSVSEWRCLASLASLKQASVVELAALTQTDKAWVSRTLGRLVGRGLVVQQVDEQDGRRVLASLTKAGAELNRKVLRMARQRNRELLKGLDPAAIESLHRMFGHLQEVARRMLESERARDLDAPPQKSGRRARIERPPAARRSALV